MSAKPRLNFRVAETQEDLEQVYRLNHITFTGEIAQHAPRHDGRLIDPFLARSTCYVCLDGSEVVGMVAVSGQRPFSLDRKLPDLDRYLPEDARPCEIRLLAVKPEHRQGRVFIGLVRCVLEYCRAAGYDIALCSATMSQARLYRHAGCREFGPRLGTKEAPFQGMYLTWAMLSSPMRRQLDLAPEPEN